MVICDSLRGLSVFMYPLGLYIAGISMKSQSPDPEGLPPASVTGARLVGLIVLYLGISMEAVLSAFFDPAASALLPELVRERELLLANTLMNIAWAVVFSVSTGLGGLIVAALGPTVNFACDALSYFLSALFILQLFPSVNRLMPWIACQFSPLSISYHDSNSDFGDIPLHSILHSASASSDYQLVDSSPSDLFLDSTTTDTDTLSLSSSSSSSLS